jgi:hypothetical protein
VFLVADVNTNSYRPPLQNDCQRVMGSASKICVRRIVADSLYGKAKTYAQRAHDGSIGCALFGFWMSLP